MRLQRGRRRVAPRRRRRQPRLALGDARRARRRDAQRIGRFLLLGRARARAAHAPAACRTSSTSAAAPATTRALVASSPPSALASSRF